ncbi:MAG: peptide chain release factor-like protein [Lentisphaeraceae bacterium]|nr:peptide chain release factor-like protein [Lentisphaeraceae bacterium]
MQNRESLLKLSDQELLNICNTDHFIATGKGGQKRNKTSSAVRVTLKDSHILASASNDRQQSVNKKLALRKLRIAIALEIREEAKPWLGQWDMNIKNPKYPIFIACLIDNLKELNWQVSEVAKAFNISTGKLIKTISRDDSLWQFVNKERQRAGHKTLKKF